MKLRDKPWPPGPHGPRPCPVCGRVWWPWAGSLLPCHARCLFTSDEKAHICSSKKSQNELAASYDVPIGIIRAIIAKEGKGAS
jgi:hypothetical protein